MVLPRFSQNFQLDFGQLVKADEPFAFVRFHDGEYALCQGVFYDAKSGWSVDGPSWIQHPLLEALEEEATRGYYIGISPPCDHSEAAAYYRGKVKAQKQCITYATIFQHSNYKMLPQLLRRYPEPVLVACKGADVQIPENGVRKRWDLDSVVERLLRVEKRPIFVAAGPCANIIIHRYWKKQDPEKRCTIIDIGSILDPTIHGKITRPFQQAGDPALRHKCDWNEWQPFQPMTAERRERAGRRAKAAETFQRLQDSGFRETTGNREHKTTVVRRTGSGIASPAVRERPKVGPVGGRNVKIREGRKK